MATSKLQRYESLKAWLSYARKNYKNAELKPEKKDIDENFGRR